METYWMAGWYYRTIYFCPKHNTFRVVKNDERIDTDEQVLIVV